MAINNKMKDLKVELLAKAVAYVNAYNARQESKSELQARKTAVAISLDEYNVELAKETFKRWNIEGDPVRTAIRLRVVPHALWIIYKTDDNDVMTFTVKDGVDYPVDLVLLESVVGADKFAAADWLDAAEKLWAIWAVRLNKRIGDNPNYQPNIRAIAKEFHFPEGVNPNSAEGVIIATQYVFDKILMIPDEDGNNLIACVREEDEDGQVYSRATEVIRQSLTGKGARARLKCYGPATMVTLVADAMHEIMTGGDFGLDFVD